MAIYTEELRKSMQAEIDEANEKLVTLVEEHNTALLAHDSDTVAARAKSIGEAVEKIRQNTLNLLYDDVHRAGSGKPDEEARVEMMRYAILHNAYEVTAIKETPVEKGSDLKKKVLDTRDLYIDLLDLNRNTPGGIGFNTAWTHAVSKLNMELTVRDAIRWGEKEGDKKSAGEITRSVGDAFLISDIARKFDLGQNPVSDKNIRKTLQDIADMMIGEIEYKVGKKNVHQIVDAHSAGGKKPKQMKSIKDKTLCFYLMGMLQVIMEQSEYEHVFQKKKED